MRVAIVAPPILGHMYRGTGMYTRRLSDALSAEDHDVKLVEYGSDVAGFDIVHYPYFDLFFRTLPIRKGKPTVVTVHDLIPLKFPSYFPPGIRGAVKWQIQKFSLAGSSAVITDSEASKEDIIKFTRISSSRIFVIPLGVGKEFRVMKDGKAISQTLAKLNLPKRFVLCVGDVNYNKNIDGLLHAFSLLVKKTPALSLILLGSGFVEPSGPLEKLLAKVKERGLADQIHRLGYVDLADLVAVYNAAKVYVQPSHAEGFGLPVLEAMASGTPVAAASRSSIPEIVKDAGVYFNPSDPVEMADTIQNILDTAALRRTLREKGLKRAKLYTWEKAAQQTLDVYKKVLGL